jgi:3-hydroxybutyryl-CoA dehydratase
MKHLTFDDIQVGDRETWTRTITETDVIIYGGLIGDRGPLHLDAEFASRTPFGDRVSYGMLGAGYIGATLAQLLGIASAYVGQTLRFRAPVLIGETITVETVVSRKDEQRRRIWVDTTITRSDGVLAVEGEGELFIFEIADAPAQPSAEAQPAG